MDSTELRRYDRQILLPELGIEGQEKLRQAKVLVVGAGGLGSPLLLYLAGAGVGMIGVIDHDQVDESNLHRQVLFNMSDIGRNKADTAVEKLKLLNPHVRLMSYPFQLKGNNAEAIIAGFDVVVDGSDNFPTRYLVNDTCKDLGKPLVFGSIYQFEGQIAVFNHQGGPDYRHLFPDPPPEEEIPNCGDGGVLGTIGGIMGTFMANEAIKLIAEFGETLSGKLMTIDALTNNIRVFKLAPVRPSTTFKKPIPAIIEIKKEALQQWENDQEAFHILDVREPFEFEEMNIGGTNIPLYELQERIGEVPLQDRLVICCSSSYRSRIAATLIGKLRKPEVYTLSI